MIYISRVCLANFKSFGPPTCIPLRPLSVLIGPNASGKSNLIDAFRFLQECVKYGVGNATTKRGGQNLLWHCDAQSEEISIDVEWKWTKKASLPREESSFVPTDLQYSLVIGNELEVVSESGKLCGILADIGQPQEIALFRRDQKQIEIWDTWQKDKISFRVNNQDQPFVGNHHQTSLAATMINNAIQNWRFYKISPDVARLCNESFSLQVSERGDNLASVLHYFDTQADSVVRERLLEIAQILSPQIEIWKTTQQKSGEVTLEIQEVESNMSIPLATVSNGSIQALAMSAIMIGAQESDSTIFVEEPDRGMHPFAVANLAHLMHGFSEVVQIIVTTHNPEFVNHCSPREVYLVDKTKGHTRVTPADTIEHISYWLKHFTLGELWVMHYLDETE